MKNQYVGDIGDYGKYGLLRFLSNCGIKIGINWYLTPNDGKSDGKLTEYLGDERMREYDSELFDVLKGLATVEGKSVFDVEQSGILSGMLCYNRFLDLDNISYKKRGIKRGFWHRVAMHVLNDCELIFADPDNGLSTKKKATEKGAQKFILPNEIADYYNAGKDVMYYHHRSRKSGEEWLAEKRGMLEYLPDAKLLAVSAHRWSNRAYIFVLHDESYDRYCDIIQRFIESSWGTLKLDDKEFFTVESI